jgi:hypothetical protein
MLHFAQHSNNPCLRLLIRHDDDDREFGYITGAEQALKEAERHDWTVVSIRDDWSTVF